jgi:hypothetical protein
LNHTVRGALVFGDTTGFKYVKNFAQSETWCVVNTKRIEAYRADKSEQFINVEISAQLLLTWKIWQSDLKPDLSNLRAELKKPLLRGMSNPRSLGLPYTVNEPVFTGACSLPIIDSTCYLLFYYWKFNPFAPHKKCAGCRYIER